ncbi:MAG: porin [Rhodothermus sp.]|nr:porin [Rhodothermus sp.]
MRFRLLLLLGLVACPAQAQLTASPTVTLGGTLQTRFSYGRYENRMRLGFGVRRARLRVAVRLSEHWLLYFQLDGTGTSARLPDAYARYTPHPSWSFRIGRLASIQPRSLALTSHRYVDAVERPVMAERWGARTIGRDGRDFGLEVAYRHKRGRFLLFLHNGDGNWDRLRGNYRESPSSTDVTGGRQRTGLAISLGGELTPPAVDGLEVGGFVSYNGAGNPNTEGRRYVSYGLHLYRGAYPGSYPFRLKIDGLVVHYFRQAGINPATADDRLSGIAALGALRLHPAAEAFARYEWLDEGRTATDRSIWTIGFSFSPSALQGASYEQQRLTVAYTTERDIPQHLLVFQWQLIF